MNSERETLALIDPEAVVGVGAFLHRETIEVLTNHDQQLYELRLSFAALKDSHDRLPRAAGDKSKILTPHNDTHRKNEKQQPAIPAAANATAQRPRRVNGLADLI